jgi:hypothetical protein
MKNAEQILKAKGYDDEEIMSLISYGSLNRSGFDIQVREEFGLGDQPLHLWDGYYRGDASEEVLEAKTKELGYQDVDQMLSAMDRRLSELAEEVEEKENKEDN